VVLVNLVNQSLVAVEEGLRAKGARWAASPSTSACWIVSSALTNA
jgi:hypothetical protein